MNEPNPMILDRLLIGDPSENDDVLEKTYVGSLGSDTVITCGVDIKTNTLYYVGSNSLKCQSQYNSDASIVRINLNNFTHHNHNRHHHLLRCATYHMHRAQSLLLTSHLPPFPPYKCRGSYP